MWLNALCTNTEGSYVCCCYRGFEGDGQNCTGQLNSLFQHCSEVMQTNSSRFFRYSDKMYSRFQSWAFFATMFLPKENGLYNAYLQERKIISFAGINISSMLTWAMFLFWMNSSWTTGNSRYPDAAILVVCTKNHFSYFSRYKWMYKLRGKRMWFQSLVYQHWRILRLPLYSRLRRRWQNLLRWGSLTRRDLM